MNDLVQRYPIRIVLIGRLLHLQTPGLVNIIIVVGPFFLNCVSELVISELVQDLVYLSKLVVVDAKNLNFLVEKLFDPSHLLAR
jgi:hypothetical protein